MFKQYQEVVLVRDFLQDTFFGKPVDLRQGQQGVIMEVYNHLGLPTGYDVEFFDEDGETISVTTVQEGDIAPLSVEKPKPKSVRTRKQKSGSQVA
jgi:hypothetical protein